MAANHGDSASPSNRVQLDYVRQTLRAALGHENFKRLHQHVLWLDVLTIVGLPVFFGVMVSLLASLPFGPLWLALFVVQGFVTQLFALVSHDLFVHRRVGGEFWCWIGSIVFTVPRFSTPTGYEQAHLSHHRFIGTARDTEAYKQDLDSRGKRLLFSTVLGVKMAQANRLSQTGRQHYHAVNEADTVLARRVRIERIVMRTWLLSLIPLAYLFPAPILLGYVLPSLLILPIVNTLRIVIEHADVNRDNPFHLSTFYRTGPISRVLFLWDSGDCHLVHHVFPRMPWYRVGEAVDLLRPVLLARGVVERHSFWLLVKGWYLDGFAHRGLWPLEGGQDMATDIALAVEEPPVVS